MRTQIVVEENVLDLTDEVAAELTFAIDDVKDFSSRNTAYSKTIVIPGTAQNNFVFGHLFELDVYNTHNPAAQNVGYNYNAGKSAKCEVLVDYMLLFKGVIRVLEIKITDGFIEYECSLAGELGGLAYAIEGKKLEELDFSAYNDVFTMAKIQASWTATPGLGVYYPLIDYGYTTDNINWPVETFRPAFYVKEYLDKIFSAAGYTYESAFLNSTYFKKLFIPFNSIYPTTNPISTLGHFKDSYELVNTGMGNHGIQFDTTLVSFFQVDQPDFRITWKRNGSINVNVVFTCDYDANALFEITLDVNGSVIQTVTRDRGTGSISISFNTDLNYNDFITANGRIIFDGQVKILNSDLLISGSSPIGVPIALGDNIVMNNCTPKNVLQKDFIISIVKMFDLYLYEDRDKNKHLKIEPYINFYNKTGLLDWTNKLDYSKEVSIKPLSELNSRKYEYKFKDDSDYYNDLYKKKWNTAYGNRIFDTTYDFVKDTQKLEIIFSPTPLIQPTGQTKIYSAIFKKYDAAGAKSTMGSNIRILHRSTGLITASEQWNVTNLGATIFSSLTYPYAGHLDDPISPLLDLNFGSPEEFYFTFTGGYLSFNLFNVYWSAYMGEIADKDSKLLTAYMRLTAADIQMLDFAKYIFIGEQLFRLNKIEDYNVADEGVTKVELLNVINIDFSMGNVIVVPATGEFNSDFNSDFNIGG